MLSIDAFRNNPNPVLDIRFHLTDRELISMAWCRFPNQKRDLNWIVSNWPFVEFYDINPNQLFVQWDSLADRCHVVSFDAKSTVKPHVDLGECIERWIEQIDIKPETDSERAEPLKQNSYNGPYAWAF